MLSLFLFVQALRRQRHPASPLMLSFFPGTFGGIFHLCCRALARIPILPASFLFAVERLSIFFGIFHLCCWDSTQAIGGIFPLCCWALARISILTASSLFAQVLILPASFLFAVERLPIFFGIFPLCCEILPRPFFVASYVVRLSTFTFTFLPKIFGFKYWLLNVCSLPFMTVAEFFCIPLGSQSCVRQSCI